MRNGRKRTARLCCAGVAVAALLVGPEVKAADPVTQLTPSDAGCAYFGPQLSENGRWVAATSLCSRETDDHQHVPDHQIVHIDRISGAMRTLTPPGVESNLGSISGDGGFVAFTSDGDLVPGQNPYHVIQVFLFDAVRQRFTQITHLAHTETRREVRMPRLSGNGDVIVFASNANLVPGENDDGNLELFVYDVKTGKMAQGTHTEFPAKHNAHLVSHDGQTVAFVGIHPPFGKRAVTGLYVWSRKTGVFERVLQPWASDVGAFMGIAMSAQSHRLAFAGRYDFVGENGDRNTELFIVDRPTGLTRQVTHTQGCTNAHPTLSADGLRVVFVSNCRFGRINEMLYANLFLMRLDTGEVIQITDSGDNYPVEAPSMDASERFVAVSIGAELNGMVNPKHLLQIASMPVPPVGPVADVPPRVLSSKDLSAVVGSRHDSDSLYLTAPQFGVMKSQDGGRFWRLLSFGLGSEHVTSLVEHPETPRLLFAGTSDVGVYKSSDGGYIWVPANVGLADQRIQALAFDPVDSSVLYADTPSGLFRRSVDKENWEQVTGPPRDPHQTARISLPEEPLGVSVVRLIPISDKIARFLRVSREGMFLLRKEDGVWMPVNTPHVPEWVAVASAGTPWLIGTNHGVFHTDRSDGEWMPASGLPAVSMSSIAFASEQTAFAAVQGGLYQSADRGLTWTRLRDIHPAARLLSGNLGNGEVMAEFEDGSLKVSRDQAAHWMPIMIPAPSVQGLEAVLFRPAQ